MKRYVVEIMISASDSTDAYRKADGLIRDAILYDPQHANPIVAWILHAPDHQPSQFMREQLEAGGDA